MSVPVLVAVDDDAVRLGDVERELRKRYEPDYRVCCLRSADEALTTLPALAAAGEQVALVLAGEVLSGRPGTGLLAEVRGWFPHAQRVLLTAWGHLGVMQAADPRTGDVLLEAIAGCRVDHHLVRPAEPPDEQFHQAVSGFLLAWAEAQERLPHTIDVVGSSRSSGSTECSPGEPVAPRRHAHRRPGRRRSAWSPRWHSGTASGWTSWPT